MEVIDLGSDTDDDLAASTFRGSNETADRKATSPMLDVERRHAPQTPSGDYPLASLTAAIIPKAEPAQAPPAKPSRSAGRSPAKRLKRTGAAEGTAQSFLKPSGMQNRVG